MKSNTKVAPVSCYCKLSGLIVYLKHLSGQPSGELPKRKAIAVRKTQQP